MLAGIALVCCVAPTGCGSNRSAQGVEHSKSVPRVGSPTRPANDRSRTGPAQVRQAKRRADAQRCRGGGYLGTDVSLLVGMSVFALKNAWQGRRGKHFTNVYAGALRKRPNRGVVMVASISVNNGPLTGPSGSYSARKPDGPFSITCVRENTVYFRSHHLRYVLDLRSARVKHVR
jgi:hypothetical protein